MKLRTPIISGLHYTNDMKKYFKKFFNKNETYFENTHELTDSFADSLALDLKRSAIDAVLNQLKKSEGKYLSTILKQSYFPVESLIFHPLDNATALETEEFFRIHNEIDQDFEMKFFKNILLKEYRTDLGACAMVPNDLIPTVQPNAHSMDNPTGDESYQITLRGSKKRFSTEVKLGILKQKNQDAKDAPKEKKFEPSTFQHIDSASRYKESQSRDMSQSVTVNITDGNGERHHTMQTPFLLGRESAKDAEIGMEKIDINGMYISRHQMIVFMLNDVVYGFIPKDASLLGVAGRRGTLQKLRLVEIDYSGLTITFGQPVEAINTTVDLSKPNLYPTIHIRRVNTAPTGHESTPIPKVTK